MSSLCRGSLLAEPAATSRDQPKVAHLGGCLKLGTNCFFPNTLSDQSDMSGTNSRLQPQGHSQWHTSCCSLEMIGLPLQEPCFLASQTFQKHNSGISNWVAHGPRSAGEQMTPQSDLPATIPPPPPRPLPRTAEARDATLRLWKAQLVKS